MKWVLMAALFLAFQAKKCNKEKPIPTPACILDKIEAVQHLPKDNPPVAVHRYRYGNTYVFLFSSPCCDQYNYVYDKNCSIICAPSGGITGNGDGGCPNFFKVATDETLIWQDTR